MGYGGLIPTKFREISEAEAAKLASDEGVKTIDDIVNQDIISIDDFKGAVNASLYAKKYESFVKISSIIEKMPQFMSYIVDMLIKHSDDFPADVRSAIADGFSAWLLGEQFLPEYLAISLVKLLGARGYERPDELFRYFRELKRNAGALIGRATLEALEGVIDRGKALEIRMYYNRADLWEKRQIIKIVNKFLTNDEKNAWYKNITMNERDEVLSIELVRYYKASGRAMKKRKR